MEEVRPSIRRSRRGAVGMLGLSVRRVRYWSWSIR